MTKYLLVLMLLSIVQINAQDLFSYSCMPCLEEEEAKELFKNNLIETFKDKTQREKYLHSIFGDKYAKLPWMFDSVKHIKFKSFELIEDDATDACKLVEYYRRTDGKLRRFCKGECKYKAKTEIALVFSYWEYSDEGYEPIKHTRIVRGWLENLSYPCKLDSVVNINPKSVNKNTLNQLNEPANEIDLNALYVYPNPIVDNTISVSFNSAIINHNYLIKIVDYLGKEVLQINKEVNEAELTMQIDASLLPKGNYLLLIQSPLEYTIRKTKFTINH